MTVIILLKLTELVLVLALPLLILFGLMILIVFMVWLLEMKMATMIVSIDYKNILFKVIGGILNLNLGLKN